MVDYKVTKLADGWLMIEGVREVVEAQKVLVQVREPRSDGGKLGKVLHEYEEVRNITRTEPTRFVAVMTERQHQLMHTNYGLGGCSINCKSYMRYANAWTDGGNWYGQPGQTARKLVRAGVPCPRELDTLIQNITAEC